MLIEVLPSGRDDHPIAHDDSHAARIVLPVLDSWKRSIYSEKSRFPLVFSDKTPQVQKTTTEMNL